MRRQPHLRHPGWTSYTSTNHVKALAVRGEELWIAAGGLRCHHRRTDNYTVYGTEHGLASNDVRALAWHGNRLWVGTAAGLSCYDRRRRQWRTFGPADGLPSEIVVALAVDARRSLLWAGTWDRGLASYHWPTEQWRTYHPTDGLADDRVLALALDGSGRLWIGTWEGGLCCYDPDREQWRTFTVEAGLPEGIVTALAVEGSGIWCGTFSGHLARYDSATDSWWQPKGLRRLAGHEIGGLAVDAARHTLWCASRGRGLQAYHWQTGRWQAWHSPEEGPGPNVTCVVLDGDQVLCGTWGRGVYQWSEQQPEWKTWAASNEPCYNRVVAIAQDPHRGLLWFGSEGGGASSFHPSRREWRTYSKDNGWLPNNIVNAIAVGPSEPSVWLGTDAGVVALDPTRPRVRHFPPRRYQVGELAYGLAVARNAVWCAPFNEGVARYDLRQKRWRWVEALPGYSYFAIESDEEWGRLWLGTQVGVLEFDLDTGQLTQIGGEGDFPSTEIRGLALDRRHGHLWAGSWSGGAYRYELSTRRWRIYTRADGLADDTVVRVAEDPWAGPEGGIWFATGEGVSFHHLATGSWKTWTTAEGLAHNFVLALGVTPEAIWLGTWGGGISRLDRTLLGLTG
jgi:ligand-binding sensor domain-containing protein